MQLGPFDSKVSRACKDLRKSITFLNEEFNIIYKRAKNHIRRSNK